MGRPKKISIEQRREMGICIDCCGELDAPGKYVRCAACRAKHMAYQKEYRSTQEKKEKLTLKEQAMREAAKRKAANQPQGISKRVERCLKCEWGSFTGSGVLCPLPEGGCMKKR